MIKFWLIVIFLPILLPPSYSISVLPPKDFFVDLKGNPKVLIVVGEKSSATDILTASSLAARLGEMASEREEEIEEVTYKTDFLYATSSVEFDYSNYYILFDIPQEEISYFDWSIENLRNTNPSGFIFTDGRAWSSKVAGVDVFDEYHPVIEYLEENNYYKIFSGLPRNYEKVLFRTGETHRYGKYYVKLLEIDRDEHKVLAELTFPDRHKEKIILPEYCHECKAVFSELFTSSSGASNAQAIAALDLLEREYGNNLIDLKYFTNPADPLYPVRPACPCLLDEVQNRRTRFNTYYEPDIAEPDDFMDAQSRIPNTSLNFFSDYQNAFFLEMPQKPPVRIYTTGFIEEKKGRISAYVSSDGNFDNLRIYYVLFEKEVDSGGTTYRNLVRGIISPDSFSIYPGASAEFSHNFYMIKDPTDQLYCLSNNFPAVDDWNKLGIAVFVEGVFYDEVAKKDKMVVLQATVLDLREKDNYVFEKDVDADKDGLEEEVEFAMECVGVEFLGNAGTGLARLNLYTFENYGIYDPPACCRVWWTDGEHDWGMTINRHIDETVCTKEETYSIDINLCEPWAIRLECMKKGDFIYGPKKAIKIVFEEVEHPTLEFKIHYINTYKKIIEKPVLFKPQDIIRFDHEIKEEDRRSKNLILVGAQNANGISRELVESGSSKTDWLKSRGEWEYIKDPFGFGHDVLIVAGSDRLRTAFAVRKLINALSIYTRVAP